MREGENKGVSERGEVRGREGVRDSGTVYI